MRSRILAAAALAAAAFSSGGAAHAATCAGTAETFVFCVGVNNAGLPTVDPDGSSYDDCVYVGAPPCTPISVPIPTVTPGSGDILYLGCGGEIGQDMFRCQSPI